jgi:hypothetical protein
VGALTGVEENLSDKEQGKARPKEWHPHGSFFVYATLVQERIKAIVIHLRVERSRGEWLILLAFLSMICIGTIFGGFQLDTQVINRPAQAIGICSPPAHIDGNNCLNTVCNVNPQNNQQVCVNLPAGYIYSVNLIHTSTTRTTT